MCQPSKESRVIRICNGTEQRDLRTSFGTNMVHTSRLADTKKKNSKLFSMPGEGQMHALKWNQ